MEQRRGQGGVRSGLLEHLSKMGQAAAAAGGNDRDVDRFRHQAEHGQVKTGLGAVGVHAGQQDLAGAALFRLDHPFQKIDAGEFPSASHHNS